MQATGQDPALAARDDQVGTPGLYAMRDALAEVTARERGEGG